MYVGLFVLCTFLLQKQYKLKQNSFESSLQAQKTKIDLARVVWTFIIQKPSSKKKQMPTPN